MTFADKLNSLFKITNSKGKELADSLHVTPPQITKMRKGMRGLPRSLDSARAIALFFAVRMDTDERRTNLSEQMKIARIRGITDENALADIILDWLNDEHEPDDFAQKKSAEFFRRFGTLFDGDISEVRNEAVKGLSSENSTLVAYYGGDGKRRAVLNFLEFLLRRGRDCTVNILTDESTSWITETPEYSSQLQGSMMRLVGQGCIFRRITESTDDINQAFESLNRWLPLYMSGKATSYCYKRMRDALNRVTIFVVPDVIVLFSFSVNNADPKEAVTFLTADQKTVNVMARDFERYLALCEPIMNTYSTSESLQKIHECMIRFDGIPSKCIQYSNSLSFITLPWDVAGTLRASDENEKRAFLVCLAQRHKKFKENLKEYRFVDIIRLADADDVIAGRASIPASYVLGNNLQFYQPAGYVQHLKSILYLLRHTPNYYVSIMEGDTLRSTIIYVKADHAAIFARDSMPLTVYDVKQKQIVSAFSEYLIRSQHERNLAQCKREAIIKISALIEDLEKRIAG